MFKRLRHVGMGFVVIAIGGVAYYFLSNPVYQRKIVQTAEEVKEDLHDRKNPKWTGTVVVVKALDGDSLLVNTEVSPRVRVSLAGIDAPELSTTYGRPNQPLAEESRAYLSQLTTNQAAEMLIIGTDLAKRPLVLLSVEGTLVNAKMAAAGLAEAIEEGAKNIPAKQRHEIANAQLAAQQKRLGIWGLANYVRPVEYRLRRR